MLEFLEESDRRNKSENEKSQTGKMKNVNCKSQGQRGGRKNGKLKTMKRTCRIREGLSIQKQQKWADSRGGGEKVNMGP